MSKGSTAASIMKVADDEKVLLYREAMPALMQHIAALAPDGELSADDLVDFFAMSIASILDNDSHLKTPQDLRKGAEVATKHIIRWTRWLREVQAETGISLLATTIGARASGEDPH
jgi:hypothetical protein